MAEVYFKKNMVLEFLCSVIRYARDEEFDKKQNESNYKKYREIDYWVKSVDSSISRFLKREIRILFKWFGINPMVLTSIIINNNINKIDEFFSLIDKISGEEYIKILYMELCIEYPLMEESLKEKLEAMYDEDEVKFISETICNPEEALYRIRYALKNFYYKFFKAKEEIAEDYINKKMTEHQEKFLELEDRFTKAVIAMDKKTLDKYEEASFYISYFLESGAYALEFIKNHISIVYGFNMEYRFDNAIIEEKKKLLFKVLADEKRVEILKLISKRTWYGNELAKHLGITTATLSYHISRLIDIGVVHFEEGENNRFYYKCDTERLKEIFEYALKDIIG